MRSNDSKYITIIALVLAVVGISIGFAAYSNSLQIQAEASVTGGGGVTPPMVGGLSVSPTTQQDGTVTPTTTGGASGEAASLSASQIQNISVHFTDVGQTATYTFYSVNATTFPLYLNDVVFGSKTCTASNANGNPATQHLTDACNDITMTIAIGAEDFTETQNNINNHAIAATSYEVVTVTIEYIDGGAVLGYGTTTGGKMRIEDFQ